jgi:sugar lactone lactonase YvrE
MKQLLVSLFVFASVASVFADPGHLFTDYPAIKESVVTGSGAWMFKTVPNFGVMPPNDAPGTLHGGIVVDKAGLIYVSTDTKRGILVFKADGTFVKNIAPEFSAIHGMNIREENGEEFIYAAHLGGHQVLKLQLDGGVVWKIGLPEESGLYKNINQYKPTAVAVAPDGSIFIADGYGQSVIHKYDANRKYVKTFGGADAGEGRTKTCHGLAIDARDGTPKLLVCDRANRRLSHWDFDGKYLGTITTGLRLPCAVSIRGDNIAVAELEGRVAIIGKDNKVAAVLGDNPDPNLRAKQPIPPEKWVPGVFTSPHGVSWDADGNIYVQDWNVTGRITKLAKQ